MSAAPEPEWIADLPPDAAEHVRKLSELPDFYRQLARFSSVLQRMKRGDSKAAGVMAREARRARPGDAAVRRDTDWYFARMVPRWHYRIINDSVRNEIYRQAIERHVKPGMIVYEIGAGTGLLAMLAAKAGAKHAYACERKPVLAEAARANVERNGLGDRVTILNKDAREVTVGEDLPARADLMVCEIVNNDLLGEFVLDLTQDAVERVLRPDAILLPDVIELRGTPVGGPDWTDTGRALPTCGLDVSAIDWMGPSVTEAPSGLDPRMADDATLLRFDLKRAADYRPSGREVEFAFREDGPVDGLVHWIWLRFGEGLVLDNRPPKPSCWTPKVHHFPESRRVSAGDSLRVAVRHDRKSVVIDPVD